MNLPAQLTSVVGRGREVAEVRRLLGRARLVTLTGAGGVGKTRLALAVAEELGETFADGLAFVDLAPVLHPDAVPPAIAGALGIRDDGDLPLAARLANALRDRELLLILDNFEHVLPAAPAVLELLRAAPRVTALVTSRAALRVRGEREYPVAPLACPAADGDEPVEALLRYPALTLFVRRARDVRPDFALAPANAPAVAELCRRLDGLPLALELAAARIRALSPEAMLGRLGLARLAVAVGQPEVAARLSGAAEALRERGGVSVSLETRRELERATATARAALGAEAFDAAMAGGATTPLARLTAEALAWMEALPSPGRDGPAPVARHPAPAAPPSGLSPREIAVLRLLVAGQSNRAIADDLGISANTVARHVSNIFDKVGAANRTEAAAFAHRHGIAR